MSKILVVAFKEADGLTKIVVFTFEEADAILLNVDALLLILDLDLELFDLDLEAFESNDEAGGKWSRTRENAEGVKDRVDLGEEQGREMRRVP